MTRYPRSGKGKKWTIKELDSITEDWKGDTLSDGEGLSGDVRCASSSVSIHFRYAFRWNKKVAWHYCGTYPAINLSDIRDERDKAKGLVNQGIDPRSEKIAARIEAQAAIESTIEAAEQKRSENLTFEDLFSEWTRDGVRRINDNEVLRQVFAKNVLPSIGDISIRDLSEHHLRKLYRYIIESGRVRTAIVLQSDIRQMLRWGEERQPWRTLLVQGNPSNLVDINRLLPSSYEPERDRILTDAEIILLKHKVDSMRRTYNDSVEKHGIDKGIKKETELAIWIMLSTLSRVEETMLIEWKHIDLENREWFIPRENTKGHRGKKRDQLVSLSDFAYGQFKQLHHLTGTNKYAFPGKKPDTPLGGNVISKQITDRQLQFTQRNKKLDFRIENNSLVLDPAIGKWTPHDLRRTGSTIMQRLGIGIDIINRCQNHAVGSKIDQVYLRHDYRDEKKYAWEKLGNWLSELLSNA